MLCEILYKKGKDASSIREARDKKNCLTHKFGFCFVKYFFQTQLLQIKVVLKS